MLATFLSSKKHLEFLKYLVLLTGNSLAIAHGVRIVNIILTIILILLGVEYFYNITGTFGPERMGLLIPSEDIEALCTIEDEIDEVMMEIRTFGEDLFKHSPNDKNH